MKFTSGNISLLYLWLISVRLIPRNIRKDLLKPARTRLVHRKSFIHALHGVFSGVVGATRNIIEFRKHSIHLTARFRRIHLSLLNHRDLYWRRLKKVLIHQTLTLLSLLKWQGTSSLNTSSSAVISNNFTAKLATLIHYISHSYLLIPQIVALTSPRRLSFTLLRSI